jgi:hypothetical protein
MFHRHDWVITGANKMCYLTWDRKPAEEVTDVLTRCTKCGKVKVTEIDGHWTMEQLRGRSL